MIAASAIASPLVKGAVQPPPLLERLRKTALDRGTARPTVDQMVGWARAFILFHNKRHPAEMGLAEVGHFLEHVVKTEPDPLPALAQARRALGTLYEDVLGVRLGELPQPRPPRVLDQLRLVLRVRHYSRRSGEKVSGLVWRGR